MKIKPTSRRVVRVIVRDERNNKSSSFSVYDAERTALVKLLQSAVEAASSRKSSQPSTASP